MKLAFVRVMGYNSMRLDPLAFINKLLTKQADAGIIH